MAYTLEKLIREAETVFPDGYIRSQFERGAADLRPIEVLAQFVVAEICGLYDPTSSDRENLSRIITNLDIASEQIGFVTRRFQELHKTALS